MMAKDSCEMGDALTIEALEKRVKGLETEQDKIHKLLTSYFYELARDYVPVGMLNKVLYNAWVNCTYSDRGLEMWAQEHATRLLERTKEISPGAMLTEPMVKGETEEKP